MIQIKKDVGLLLIIMLILGVLTLNLFAPTPFSIATTFLTLIVLPGFFLSEILDIKFSLDRLGNVIIWLALGFIFNLLCSLVAIISHMTITVYVYFYVIILLMLLVAGCAKIFKTPTLQWEFKWQGLFQARNLGYILLFAFVFLVLTTVNQLGTNFTGDPLYHLALIRKVVEGQSITIANLNFVKDQFHIAYGLPVWHVFLGLLSKITNTNIFTLYRELSTGLTLIVFVVWYWFFLKFLPNKNIALIAILLFGIYHYGPNGYIFTRVVVPDTLAGLILMPLSLGLALKYIFDKTSNLKHLVVLSLLLPLMGLVHWTQYFYYLFAMGLFAILYVIFELPKFDIIIVKKIAQVIFTNMVITLPLLAILQFAIVGISSNLEAFSVATKVSNNDRLYKFPTYVKMAYIFLPLLILFKRNNRLLIFLGSVFLVGPLVYNIPGLYQLLRSNLSHVFVNRLYTNLGEWPFVIWAIILGFGFVLIDRLSAKLTKSWSYSKYIINTLVAVILVYLLYLQFKYELLEEIYKNIFSDASKMWLNNYYWYLIGAIALGSVLVFVLQKYYLKLTNFFKFDEVNDYFAYLVFVTAVVAFFSVNAQSNLTTHLSKELSNRHFISKAYDPTFDIVNPDKFGGLETLEYIKNNIAPKSVFDTNTRANYTLPTMADVHMASYTFDQEPTLKYRDLYDPAVSLEKKVAMLKEGDIDYLIYQYELGEYLSVYDPYPQYFEKIYTGDGAAIYKVNKEQVRLDLGI